MRPEEKISRMPRTNLPPRIGELEDEISVLQNEATTSFGREQTAGTAASAANWRLLRDEILRHLYNHIAALVTTQSDFSQQRKRGRAQTDRPDKPPLRNSSDSSVKMAHLPDQEWVNSPHGAHCPDLQPPEALPCHIHRHELQRILIKVMSNADEMALVVPDLGGNTEITFRPAQEGNESTPDMKLLLIWRPPRTS
ncbi:hypothetical protein V8E54_004313 [Elaphomyces granulatus]